MSIISNLLIRRVSKPVEGKTYTHTHTSDLSLVYFAVKIKKIELEKDDEEPEEVDDDEKNEENLAEESNEETDKENNAVMKPGFVEVMDVKKEEVQDEVDEDPLEENMSADDSVSLGSVDSYTSTSEEVDTDDFADML